MSTSKWVPLEANPEVFNKWSKPLGLPSNLIFRDLYSLDPDFLQYTPRPVYAVLLLFPSRGKLGDARKEEQEKGEGKWEGKNGAEEVWFIKQTIGNACGSIGLLHSLLNLPSNLLSPDSPLTTFKSQSLPLTPLSRAQLLDTSPFFEQAHNSSVSSGQSKVPVSQEEIDTDNHFLSFVMGEHKDGSKHVCEMDGSYRDGPFDRGQTSEESFLTDVAKIVREKYIDRADGDLNFSLITLGVKGEDDE